MVDFSLGNRLPDADPEESRPLANPCNPTPRSPQWSAKTHSPDQT
jgi:hypothetical protein